LFHNHQYEEALSLFLELNVSAEDIIALYPAVISGHLHPKEDEVVSSPKSADENLEKQTKPVIMSMWTVKVA